MIIAHHWLWPHPEVLHAVIHPDACRVIFQAATRGQWSGNVVQHHYGEGTCWNVASFHGVAAGFVTQPLVLVGLALQFSVKILENSNTLWLHFDLLWCRETIFHEKGKGFKCFYECFWATLSFKAHCFVRWIIRVWAVIDSGSFSTFWMRFFSRASAPRTFSPARFQTAEVPSSCSASCIFLLCLGNVKPGISCDSVSISFLCLPCMHI